MIISFIYPSLISGVNPFILEYIFISPLKTIIAVHTDRKTDIHTPISEPVLFNTRVSITPVTAHIASDKTFIQTTP